jgi:hypothetical protein
MAQCEYRKRPSDDLSCKMFVDPHKTMCPRHIMMAQAETDAERAREVKRRIEGKKKPSNGPMPYTRKGLIEGGYSFTGTGECAGCGEMVEWWRTPNQRPAPFNRMPDIDSQARSHFATCTKANSFRRKA